MTDQELHDLSVYGDHAASLLQDRLIITTGHDIHVTFSGGEFVVSDYFGNDYVDNGTSLYQIVIEWPYQKDEDDLNPYDFSISFDNISLPKAEQTLIWFKELLPVIKGWSRDIDYHVQLNFNI